MRSRAPAERAENGLGEQKKTRATASAPTGLDGHLTLASTIGNRAFGRLLQAKLTVGSPNDEYEREADQTADQVIKTPDSKVVDPGIRNGQPAKIDARDSGGRIKPIQASNLSNVGMASKIDAASSSTGLALNQSIRHYMEARFGYDFSRVRVHADNRASASAKAVNAIAYTFGNNIVFRQGAYEPATTRGRRLLAHELTHVVQQNTRTMPYVARSVDEWLTGSVNIRGMSYTQLLSKIDELVQWQNRQIESNEETTRIEEALTQLRREAGRREAQTQQRRRRRRSRRTQTQQQLAMPTRRPRILQEMSSFVYEDPAEMRAEYDLIMEWLASEGLSAQERQLLQTERQNLAPQLQQDRARAVVERRAARLQTALTPADQDQANSLLHAARTIQGIEADQTNSELFYIYHNRERVPISRAQADQLRSDILNQLQRAHRLIGQRVEYYWNRYQAQIDINEDTFAIDVIAGWLGGVTDPGDELRRRRRRARRDLTRLEASARDGELVQAAAALAPLERNSQVIRRLSRAFYEGHIEGAEIARTGLEFTRDASFAIAASIAAVVAAPVIAGAVAGLGATGVTAGVATTLGTGVVVGTGTSVVRGSSAVVGHGIAGSSREQIREAFVGESIQGFREGFLAGAAGGAARVLGPALGVGTQVSRQVARRVAAGAIVDGTTAMVETLWRGGSPEEAVAAGLRSAALSVPGSLVGASSNRMVRELGGPLTAGAVAYAGAIANGATPQEAMRSAGLAVTSNLVMSRASHGADADAALESRGRAIGQDLRATASRARRHVANVAAATMIGTADPVRALRSGFGGTMVAAELDLPATRSQDVATRASEIEAAELRASRQSQDDLSQTPAPEATAGTSPLELDTVTTSLSESQVMVVTRLQDVDVGSTSLPLQQRVEYERQFVQYNRNVQAAFDAGRRQSPPMTRENYIRFRHGIATGQIIPNASSHVGALIDEALVDAVSPEQAFGFTRTQADAAGVVLGKSMTSSEIDQLGHIWQNAENAGEVTNLTRENSRRLFDNHRNRFWRAVRGSISARTFFESMGFTFPDSPTTAPVRELPDGRTVRVTIDHITERQADPSRALDAGNLRFSFGRENSVVLRLLHELDPFQRYP